MTEAPVKSNGHIVLSNDDDWVIDLNVFKAKERPAIDAALKSGKDEDSYPYMARAIKVWPFKALDPSDPSSYGELGLVEQTEAVTRFVLSFQRVIDAMQALAKRYQTAGEGHSAGRAAEPPDGSGS